LNVKKYARVLPKGIARKRYAKLALVLTSSTRCNGRRPKLNAKLLARKEVSSLKVLIKNVNNKNETRPRNRLHVKLSIYGLYFSCQLFLDKKRVNDIIKIEANNRNKK